MPRSLTVTVEPGILKWLRQSSGWSIEDAGRRIRATASTMQDLESGKKLPTLRQLGDLSSAYRYPLASFFLSAPKEQKPLPKDYRLLPNRKDRFDKKTIWAIRRSRRLQGIGMELSQNINRKMECRLASVGLDDDPADVAARYRKLFDLSFETQKNLPSAYKLFNRLRSALEGMNLLVFQFPMPIEDARGFALVDEDPPVVVVSSKDRMEARLFTLMHEFGHVLLGETAIDVPDASRVTRNNVERWCNAFASSFLLPDGVAQEMFEDKRHKLTETETLNALSRKCKVSKAVLLRKMLDLGHIRKSQFRDVLERHAQKNRDGATSATKPIITPDKRRISEVGSKFISLVADNFDKSLITYADVLSYLSIKSGRAEKVLSEADT